MGNGKILFWLAVGAAVFISIFDSFGLESDGKRASELLVQSLISPFHGGQERVGQDEIAIVLFDDATLDLRGIDRWPPDYSTQADIIAAVAAYQPRAIFYDFYFETPHGEEPERALADFARQIDFARQDGVPVVIGPVGDNPTFAPLREARQAGISWPGTAYTIYPATDSEGRPMAAFDLYRIWADDNGVDPAPVIAAYENDPLTPSWGFGSSPSLMAQFGDDPRFETYRTFCGVETLAERAMLALRMAGTWVFNELLAEEEGAPAVFYCPYFATMSASDLFRLFEGKDPGEMLTGKIVLVGSGIEWLKDDFPAPVYGNVPGVYVHAAALDTLIEYGPTAARKPPVFFLAFDAADLVKFAVAALAFALVFVGRRQPHGSAIMGEGGQFRLWFILFVLVLPILISLAITMALFKWPAANVFELLFLGFVAITQIRAPRGKVEVEEGSEATALL